MGIEGCDWFVVDKQGERVPVMLVDLGIRGRLLAERPETCEARCNGRSMIGAYDYEVFWAHQDGVSVAEVVGTPGCVGVVRLLIVVSSLNLKQIKQIVGRKETVSGLKD